MNTSPMVTTIIPAFNAEPWLAAAIDSALLQDVDQEILVINDGSKDRTAEIAAAYPPPVRLITKTNGGVSSARNIGLEEAKGEFIAFLDADDVWLPGKLRKQLDAFRAFPSTGTVVCDEMHVNDQGQVVKESFFATKSFFDELPKQTAIAAKPMTWLVKESFFPTSGVVTRRRTAQQAGKFDETLSIVEDRDYWIRLVKFDPVVVVPDILLKYRLANPMGLSITGQKKWAENLFSVLLRNLPELETAIKSEGGNLENTIGAAFENIAETMWNNENYSGAGNAYRAAKKYGKQKFLKQLTATTGFAPLAVKLKKIIGFKI